MTALFRGYVCDVCEPPPAIRDKEQWGFKVGDRIAVGLYTGYVDARMFMESWWPGDRVSVTLHGTDGAYRVGEYPRAVRKLGVR